MHPLFIAIPLPEDIRKNLSRICHGAPSTQWCDEENFHLTLRYLGIIKDNILWDIEDALKEIEFSAFQLSLKSVGYFSTKDSKGVFWAGIENSPEVELLKKKIDSALRTSHIEPEPRGFKPHITLGRTSHLSPERISTFLEAHYLFSTPPFSVDRFALFSTHKTEKRLFYQEETVFKSHLL